MRYLARRYGEFHGFRIPDVVSAGDNRLPKQSLESRRNSEFIWGDIVVLNRADRRNARNFVNYVLMARYRYPDKILYLPAFGLPFDYPVLFYLGIDILDDSPIFLLGDERCVSEFGVYVSTKCIEENLRTKDRILNLINTSLEHGKFRELVENLSVTSFSREALRISDLEFYERMERFMDFRKRRINAINVESIHRPEVVNFRKRVLSLSQTADNLLLIPCSAVKPYSRSKTHRILRSAIWDYLQGIQEVIVTSPLGLVPREVENFFPAADYDIPVTGHWFGEEKDVLFDLATNYFSGKSYSNVFYILPRDEAGMVKIFEGAIGVEGSINYENSEKIRKIIEGKDIKGNRITKEKKEIANVLRYLYSVDLGWEDISLKSEGNRKFIIHKGKYLAKVTESGVRMMSGLAELLHSRGVRVVEVDGVFKGSNVFIPGIKKISQDVRPGMEVVLVNEGVEVGSGISQLADFDMRIEKKGVGITDVSYF